MATEWLDGETNTVYTRSKSQERNLQDQEDSPTLFALIFHFAMFLSAPKNFASNNWQIYQLKLEERMGLKSLLIFKCRL